MPLRESKTFYQPVILTVFRNRNVTQTVTKFDGFEEIPSMSIFDNTADALKAGYAMRRSREEWLLQKLNMHDTDNEQLEWLDYIGWTQLPEFVVELRQFQCNMTVDNQDSESFPDDKIPL